MHPQPSIATARRLARLSKRERGRSTRTLTVLAKDGDGWRELASRKLDGEVALNSVVSGIVVVDRWPLHPPKCCPGKKYEDRYMLMAGRLVDAK